jgi:hypothetical protein
MTNNLNKLSSVSFFCPAYNDEKNLPLLIPSVHKFLSEISDKFEIVIYLIKLLHMEKEVKITEVDSSYFKTSYFAPRPRREKLLNTKLKALNPGLVRDWKICLEEYINKFDWGI